MIAVETLSAMAHGLIARKLLPIEPGTLLCPMIDARRMEVYTALFDAKGKEIKATSARL